MSGKWTPGPWRIGTIKNADIYGEGSDGPIALVIKGLPETVANARLISVAPELYESLRNLLLLLLPDECLEDIHYRAAHKDQMIAEAARALAKARGES